MPRLDVPPDCLAIGRAVCLSRPRPAEFDRIIRLRCSGALMRWSLREGRTDPESTWLQLRFGFGWPACALLAVRQHPGDRLLGAIGWSGWDRDQATAWLGQLVLDTVALRHLASSPGRPTEVALDAGLALRDFMFERMGLKTLSIFVLEGNTLSDRISRAAGFVETRRAVGIRADDQETGVVYMQIAREGWESLPRHATFLSELGEWSLWS